MLNKLLNKLKKHLKYFYRKYLLKDPMVTNITKWYSSYPDEELRYDFNDINSNSIIFDLGGYKGSFAEKIYSMYESKIYVFEPYEMFFRKLEFKFRFNEKIKIYNYAISDRNYKTNLIYEDEGTRLSSKTNKSLNSVSVRDITEVIKENEIEFIDLLKLNVEGSEYEILIKLINSGFINKVKYLQIQYHYLNKESSNQRNFINSLLIKTHNNIYSYPFVWEGWKKL